MGFESGSFALTIFTLGNRKLPDDFLELFSKYRAGSFDSIQDEPQIGWVSGRHLLENTIDENTAIKGGHLYLNLRKAERKIPNTLLNAMCRREELVYMQANDMSNVPARVKREIKQQAIEKHLMKMPPVLSAVPFVIDRNTNTLYLGTTSAKLIDVFVALFLKTMEIEPMQICVSELMLELFEAAETGIPEMIITDTSADEAIPARDFLTWLWFYSEKHDGLLTLDKYGDFNIIVEGPLTFAFAAEARGAAETTIKKGNSPLRSAEAKSALAVGKKLKKAKLTIARDRDVWGGTFDADRFAFSGLTLPEGEELEAESRFAERVEHLHMLKLALYGYFKKFVETIRDPHWKETERKIAQWARERESY